MNQHNEKTCSCRHEHDKHDWIVVGICLFLLVVGVLLA